MNIKVYDSINDVMAHYNKNNKSFGDVFYHLKILRMYNEDDNNKILLFGVYRDHNFPQYNEVIVTPHTRYRNSIIINDCYIFYNPAGEENACPIYNTTKKSFLVKRPDVEPLIVKYPAIRKRLTI